MDPIARTEHQLAAALRRYRKQAELTQTDIAAATQKRQATISSLEAGAGGNLDTLFAVLTALNLELVVRPRRAASVHDLEDIF
jgi:HTH-type transcriptional regulator/antitoxin HipB